MKSCVALLLVCAASVTASASSGRPVDLASNARAAEQVVVATVSDVQARFDVNEYGDRLIVSQVWLEVSETLKGQFTSVVSVDVEGGTVGDLRLDVSDIPALKRGQRGVFFLDSKPSGGHKPHSRGQGLLMLDASDRVQNSTLSLADVKALVRSAQR
jgi:hypothetical protein